MPSRSTIPDMSARLNSYPVRRPLPVKRRSNDAREAPQCRACALHDHRPMPFCERPSSTGFARWYFRFRARLDRFVRPRQRNAGRPELVFNALGPSASSFGWVNNAALIESFAAGGLDISAYSNGNITLQTGTRSTVMTISGSNVGIGTTSPNTPLYAYTSTTAAIVATFRNGTGTCTFRPTTTTTNWTCTSDARLKKDIVDTGESLARTETGNLGCCAPWPHETSRSIGHHPRPP
jgi:hypothetical protein